LGLAADASRGDVAKIFYFGTAAAAEGEAIENVLGAAVFAEPVAGFG